MGLDFWLWSTHFHPSYSRHYCPSLLVKLKFVSSFVLTLLEKDWVFWKISIKLIFDRNTGTNFKHKIFLKSVQDHTSICDSDFVRESGLHLSLHSHRPWPQLGHDITSAVCISQTSNLTQTHVNKPFQFISPHFMIRHTTNVNVIMTMTLFARCWQVCKLIRK